MRLGVVVGSLLLASCTPTTPTSLRHAIPLPSDDGQLSECKIAKNQLAPLVVEWPAVNKVSLASVASEGIVVVRYDGCRMKVLSECAVQGSYAFDETPVARDGFDLKTKQDLYARLPLGAVSLSGELKGDAQLRVDYVATGVRRSDIRNLRFAELPTRCDGATHFVRKMVVGAYRLSRSQSTAVGASVGALGGEARGDSHALSSVLKQDGRLEDCTTGKVPAAERPCQAVVQLELGTIEGVPAEEAPAPMATAPADAEPAPANAQHAPEDSPPQSAWRRMGAYGLGGLGLALTATGVYFGTQAKSKAEEVVAAARWTSRLDEEGKAAERNMYACYGIAAAALVGSVVLFMSGSRTESRPSSVSVVPSLWPGGGGLLVGAGF